MLKTTLSLIQWLSFPILKLEHLTKLSQFNKSKLVNHQATQIKGLNRGHNQEMQMQDLLLLQKLLPLLILLVKMLLTLMSKVPSLESWLNTQQN